MKDLNANPAKNTQVASRILPSRVRPASMPRNRYAAIARRSRDFISKRLRLTIRLV